MEHWVKELTSAIAAGDAEAFTRLYREEFDTLVALAKRATGRDEAFAMDVVQEVMLKVIRRLPVIDSREQLGGWLARVTLTTSHDALRADARRRRRDTTSGQAVLVAEPERHDAERLAWIRDELAQMDAATSAALRTRLVEGRTLAAVGRLLGLTPGAVDGRVSRTVRALRERAREVFDD